MTMLMPLESTKIAYHIKKDLQSLNCINSVEEREKKHRGERRARGRHVSKISINLWQPHCPFSSVNRRC